MLQVLASFLFTLWFFFFLGIQICLTSEEEQDGFIRVLSGKKRGLVPLDVLENVWLLAPPPLAISKLCCNASSHTVSTKRSCHTDPATQETVRQDSRAWGCGEIATRQRVHCTAYPGCPRWGCGWKSLWPSENPTWWQQQGGNHSCLPGLNSLPAHVA